MHSIRMLTSHVITRSTTPCILWVTALLKDYMVSDPIYPHAADVKEGHCPRGDIFKAVQQVSSTH